MTRRSLLTKTPIHRRLPLMMLLACCFAVVLSSALYLTYDIISFQHYTTEHLNGIARIVGINSTAALMFKDQETGANVLASLRKEHHILGAAIYDNDCELFASFIGAEDCQKALAAFDNKLPSDLGSGITTIDHPIELDNETIGYIRICVNTSAFRAHIYRYAAFILVVVVAVCILAFYYSRRILRQVVKPLALLTDAATRITRDGDYSVRVNTSERGEMAGLVVAFNTMLDVIDANAKTLVANQERLRAMNRSLYMTEEKERLALASTLHDTVCQTLFGMQMTLGTLLANQEKSRRFEERIQILKDLVNGAINEARLITTRLAPRSIQELGLVSALESEATDQMKDCAIAVDIRDCQSGVELPPKRRMLAFRCVQELLRNIRKHANAKNIIIEVKEKDAMLCITVSDDGVGFDPVSAMNSQRSDGGFGLFSIVERIRFEGGTVDMTSARGKGTAITLKLPCGSKDSNGPKSGS